ncbi:MAG: HAD family phosphatase [Oscillospiraceae bacterium]|nr:HAD family phosphatase [Oscillospiraceae bacterium]
MTQELVKGLPYQMTPFAIFDLDGTLIDSMPVWEGIDYEMLTARGVVYDPVATTEATKALSIEESIEYWRKNFGLTESMEELKVEVNARIRQAYATVVPLKPHVHEYLDYLKQQGVRMCVATSSELEQVEVVMRRLDLWDRFEFVVTAREVGRGKEFPDIYLEAARRMGAAPHECTVYEDTLAAVKTAAKAGFHTVGVADSCGVAAAAQISAESQCYILDYSQLM